LLANDRIDPECGKDPPFVALCQKEDSNGIVNLLAKDPRIDVNRPGSMGMTPLIGAVLVKNALHVKAILGSGKYVQVRALWNRLTAEEYAYMNGFLSVTSDLKNYDNGIPSRRFFNLQGSQNKRATQAPF